MNLKTLGTFVVIFAFFVVVLGVAVLAFGGVKWVTNAPVAARTQGMNFMDAAGQQLMAMDQNYSRGAARQQAIKLMVAGGIVTFLGTGAVVAVVVAATARKKTPL